MFASCTQRFLFSLLALPVFVFSSSVWSQDAGRGATADFEVDYLQFIIDHDYSALRLTEIAAGTAEIRQAEITGEEGVSPTPGTDALEGRAERDHVRALAREVNNRNRDHILKAQSYLRDWYGIDYTPQVSAENEEVVQQLEQVEAGNDFDRVFLEALSRHHYQGSAPTLNCIVGREIDHNQLYRFCKGILENNLLEIEGMRELLYTEYALEDFQPFALDNGNDGINGEEATDGNGVPAGDGATIDDNDGAGAGNGADAGAASASNTQPEVVQSDAEAELR